MKLRVLPSAAKYGLLVIWASLSALAQPWECQLQIGDPEVFRIAQLQGVDQQVALRELLSTRKNVTEAVFYYGDRLRPALRLLLRDGIVGHNVAGLLAFIAEPEDIKLIIGMPPPPQKPIFANRWAYGVSCSLLEPTSEEEWAFLRKCAINGFDDRWVDAGGIQSLKLLASPRSREILEEAQRINAYRERTAVRALEYLNSKPAPLTGPKLQPLAALIAQALSVGEWKGNSAARCDETGSKALVDFTFEGADDHFIYTATFHRLDTNWMLRGVRETMQTMVGHPRPLPPIKR